MIKCEQVSNLRDIGNLKTKDGRFTKNDTIYRSNCPEYLSRDELNYFHKHHLELVIDLRNSEELKKKINFFQGKVNYVNIPLKGEKAPNKENDIPYIYMDILSDYDKISKIFKLIIETPGSILINCSAGKDRTGVIIMLLLLVSEVNEEEIINNYSLSYENIKEEIKLMHEKDTSLPEFLGQSKASYMEKTLELFKVKYGNISSYVKYLNINEKKIGLLKNKLL